MQLMQTMDELDLFFAQFVTDNLGISQDRSLVMYSQDGQPTFDINVDCCFVNTAVASDIRLQQKQRQQEYDLASDSFLVTQQAMRTLEVKFIFYGPSSLENAQKLSEIYHTEQSRYVLAKNYLSAVYEQQNGPTQILENSSGRWYRRADLSLFFYNTIAIEETIQRITSADIETKYDM